MKAKKKKPGYRQVFLIICAAFWSIYPFVTRVIIKHIPEIETKFFANQNGIVVDLLLFAKEVALAVFAGVVILYFLGERIFPDKIEKLNRDRALKLKSPLICIGIYALFSVFSFLLSDYKETAFWGSNSEYEGLLAVLGYCTVFVFGLYYLKATSDDEKSFSATRIFKNAVLAVSALVGVLALLEIYYKPILEIPIVQDLISSQENRQIARGIKNENFIGQICLTFNNPGYLGGFCALFLPVCFVVSQNSGKVKRWVFTVTEGVLLLTVWWSDSKVAMAALGITFPLAAISSYIYISRNRSVKGETVYKESDYSSRKKGLVVSFVSVLLIGGVMILMSKVLPTYSSRVRPEGNTEASAMAATGQGLYKLSKAEIKNGVLYLRSGDNCLSVSVDPEILNKCYADYENSDFADCLIFSDGRNKIEERKPVVLKATNIRDERAGFVLEDERFKDVYISVDKELLIFDFGYKGSVEFYITNQGIRIFGQGSVLLEEIPQPAVKGLENIYSFGTGRGYIWAQTLPVLRDSTIFGGGNGTFAFRFRQNEIVGLLNTHGSCKYVIDRPHNWYLQIACSDGIPALVAVLVLFVSYVFGFFGKFGRLYIWGYKRSDKNKDQNSEQTKSKSKDMGNVNIELLDIGLFFGLVGFMLCGFINDSCITVNPLFWLLLGWAVSRQATIKKVS